MNQQFKENQLLSWGWEKRKTKPVYIIEFSKDPVNGDTKYF